MPKLPKRCPACNANLNITRLTCPDCGTEVTGNFPPDLFSRLAPNDFDFIVLFVKSKGNIKEMERELGISYWTIRTRLGELVDQLGLEAAEAAPAPSQSAPGNTPAAGMSGAAPVIDQARREEISTRRQSILEQLNAGLLSVTEAAARLEELKKQERKSS
jgi:hypothetical protein